MKLDKIQEAFISLNKTLNDSVTYTLTPCRSVNVSPVKTLKIKDFSKVVNFAKMIDVEDLNIYKAIIDTNFHQISSLENLSRLELFDTIFLQKNDIKWINFMKLLKEIYIYNVDCSFFNEDFSLELPYLKKLLIEGKETNLHNMSFLSKFGTPLLECIDLAGVEISDLSKVEELKDTLKELYCDSCHLIPKSQLRRLRHLMPDVFFPPPHLLK